MPNLVQTLENVAARGAEGLAHAARAELAAALRELQRPDGGFAGLDGRSDPYFSFFAWLGLRALAAPFDRERLCSYLASTRLSDTRVEARCATVVLVREGRRSRLAGWADVLRAWRRGEARDAYGLFLLGLLSDALLPGGLPRAGARLAWRRLAARAWERLPTPQLAAHLVLSARAGVSGAPVTSALLARRCVSGGFASAAGAPPDLLATAVARLALEQAGPSARVPLHSEERQRDLAFVESCWLEDGLFGPSPSAAHGDAEHAFYGLLALGTCRGACNAKIYL